MAGTLSSKGVVCYWRCSEGECHMVIQPLQSAGVRSTAASMPEKVVVTGLRSR